MLFFYQKKSSYLKLILFICNALQLTGCFTSMQVGAALESRPIDTAFFETKKAFISKDNELVIFEQGGYYGDNTDKTITVNMNNFSHRYNLVPSDYDGTVYLLPNSIRKEGFKSLEKDHVQIPIVDITTYGVAPPKGYPFQWVRLKRETNATLSEHSIQLNSTTNPYDLLRSNLMVEEGQKGTLYVWHHNTLPYVKPTKPYDPATLHGVGEYVYVSNKQLNDNNNYIAFKIERKNSRRKLELLLFTPLTLAIDVITSPFQILFFSTNKGRPFP